MTTCYSCGRRIQGKVHRSTIGKPACRGCSNLQVGAVVGGASGASTGETLGLIHVLNSWRTGTRKSTARDEADTRPLVEMPWKRPRRKVGGDA